MRGWAGKTRAVGGKALKEASGSRDWPLSPELALQGEGGACALAWSPAAPPPAPTNRGGGGRGDWAQGQSTEQAVPTGTWAAGRRLRL